MKYLLLSLVALLVGFNLFAHINQQSLCEFDEARHVASALEMLRNHHYVVTYYGGVPDYWNAKPPLSEWGAALGYSLLPEPLLGVRLFSLLAALVCSAVVFCYTRRLAGFGAALLAVALFITTRPLLINHGARSADADMLFIGLVSLGMLGFAAASRPGIALGYVALGLAFLAKSFHVAPYALAALMFTVLLCRRGQLRLIDVVLLPLCGLLPVLPWALARYLADGGQFFKVMLFYDVLARSTGVIEGHVASHWLYLNRLFLAFGLLLGAPLALLWPRCRGLLREPAVQLLLLWALLPLAVYSLSQSKLPWYIFPTFPAFACLIAVILQRTLPLLRRGWRIPLIVVVVLTLAQNETIIAGQIVHNRIDNDAVAIALMKIGESTGQGRARVYLSDGIQPPRQHYYATALLYGTIDLEPGGAAGFAADRGAGPRYLLGLDGRVLGR